MIGSELLSLSYILVNKDVNTFLNGNTTDSYAHLNRAYGKRILDILRVRVDKNASIKEVTLPLLSVSGLVAGVDGYNGERAFPTDLLRPVRVEVSFDGVTWNKCKIYDNELNTSSEFNTNQINGTFSESEPSVDFTRNSFKIRPLKTTDGDIAQGIYIEYEKRQTDFTSSTAPTEIESNLQDILAWDLAKLETVMHSSKYSSQELAVFNSEYGKAEQRFLAHYMTNLPTKKTMSFNFNSLPR